MGREPYSPSAEDKIKTFLQCFALAPQKLQNLLIANSKISGFDRSEFVFIKLDMFDTPEAQKTREVMRANARIKYRYKIPNGIDPNDNQNDITTVVHRTIVTRWLIIAGVMIVCAVIAFFAIMWYKNRNKTTE